MKNGSCALTALFKLSAKLFEESTDTSYPNLASCSINSWTSFYLGGGCLLNIANEGKC